MNYFNFDPNQFALKPSRSGIPSLRGLFIGNTRSDAVTELATETFFDPNQFSIKPSRSGFFPLDPSLNQETTDQQYKEMQDFDPEEFTARSNIPKWVKAPSIVNNTESKECVDLLDQPGVFRLNEMPSFILNNNLGVIP